MSFWQSGNRIEYLKALWASGLTASQCGAKLGCTRSSVLSKVHRLGLAGRIDARTPPRRTTPRKFKATHPGPTIKPSKYAFGVSGTKPPTFLSDHYTPAPDLVIPVAERKSLLDLTETSCRWPIGDPQHADFHFCNRSKVTGLPYCEHHARKAYVSPAPRHNPVAPAISVEREKVDA